MEVGGGGRPPRSTCYQLAPDLRQVNANAVSICPQYRRRPPEGQRRRSRGGSREEEEEGPPPGPRPLQASWRPQADAHVAASITRPSVSASCQTPPLPQAEAGDGRQR